MKFARMIGRSEFDKAIDYLRAGLKDNASDAASLEMIANCHHWAGRNEQAIVACREALACDPNAFEMHALLARLLAEKGEKEGAAIHARQGLEHYPEPLPAIPRFYMSAFNALCRIAPSFHIANPEEAIRRVDTMHADWFHWAKRYLEWYDQAHGTKRDSVRPTEH